MKKIKRNVLPDEINWDDGLPLPDHLRNTEGIDDYEYKLKNERKERSSIRKAKRHSR